MRLNGTATAAFTINSISMLIRSAMSAAISCW
jgi:hypothetical protein